jgi:hypothetical protein
MALDRAPLAFVFWQQMAWLSYKAARFSDALAITFDSGRRKTYGRDYSTRPSCGHGV